MKNIILAGLLAALGGSAYANEYYVVIPIGKPVAGQNINVVLNSVTLPAGMEGDVYTGFDFGSALQVTGDPQFAPGNVSWSVVSGALPAGLALSSAGQLTGTPTEAGTSTFKLQASYKTKSGSQDYQVIVGAITISLFPASLPSGKPGTAYSYDFKPRLTVTGDPQYTGAGVTWSVQGVLQQGLQFNSDGTITGVPTVSGLANLTVQASYKNKSTSFPYSLRIRSLGADLQPISAPSPSYDFGTVTLPFTGSWNQQYTFVNEGLATGSLATPTFGGANPGDFLITNSCTNVAPNNICNFGVKFKPTQVGIRSATLSIAGTTITFSGTGR